MTIADAAQTARAKVLAAHAVHMRVVLQMCC